MDLRKVIWVFLFVNAILFLALIIALGWLQLPVGDDLIYRQLAQQLGIWDSTMLMRDEWNGRWMAILLNQTLHALIPEHLLGSAFQSITIGLGIVAFHPISEYFVEHDWSQIKRVALSINLLLGLFLLSFGHTDSWFWMCSQPAYLWASLIGFWVITILFKERLNWWQWLLIIAAHIYVGGSSEVVAISMLTVEFSLLLFRKQLPLLQIKPLIIGLLFLMTALIFALMGEGVENRYAFLEPPAVGQGLLIGIKSYLKTLFYGIGSKLPYILVITATLLAIKPKDRFIPIFDWKIPFGIGDGVLICTMFLTAFTLGDIGPNRALLHISITVLALIILGVFRIRRMDEHLPIIQRSAILFGLFLTLFLGHQLINELPKDAAYAKALQERYESIERQIDQGESRIELPRLPKSKFLYSTPLSNDPSSEHNRQLSTIYGDELEFVVISEE